MKNLILLVSLTLFSLQAFVANAQIIEEERSMTLGVKNALVLEIPNATEKVATKTWKKYLKQFKGKTKKIKKTDDWLTDDVAITAIGGANTVDVYARIAESGESVIVTTWVDLGGAFVSSYEHAEKYDETQKILMRFAIEVAKEMTKIELEEEEKKLKKLESNLKKLVRAKEGYKKDIEDAKKRIAQAEQNIIQNEKDQETTNEEIGNQEGVVEQVKEKLSDLDN